MISPLGSRLVADTFDIEELVNSAWRGQIRIPHFQRDFRWNWLDIYRLFDSVAKGYPIGSLLLWRRRADAASLQFGGLTIDAPAIDEALWVVDGQQRLTSLANALHPNAQNSSRFGLAYSLLQDDFVKTPAVEDPTVIPLPVIFDLQAVIKWFARYPEISERLDQATDLTRRIRQFEVPAYLVTQDDPKILQDIFDRMNNFGKRLSRAEIFSALNAGEEHEGNTSEFERIAQRIDVDLSFGIIDNDTVLAAILARRGAEVRRDIRTEFTKDNDEGRDAAYRAGELALRRTVNWLQEQANVPHFSFLAYRYLLVVLTRFFAFHPDLDARTNRLLRRWYWQAAVVGPEQFKGSTANAARILCSRVQRNDAVGSIQGLLEAVAGVRRPRPDLHRFKTSDSATKLVICCWWARGPRDPRTAERYDFASLAAELGEARTARDAVRYLVPRSTVPYDMRPWAANRALMPGLDIDWREIASLLESPPLDLTVDQWLEMLDSHSLDETSASMLRQRDLEPFFQWRQERLSRELDQFLSQMCEWGLENTPPISSLILDDEDEDDDEKDLRDVLD